MRDQSGHHSLATVTSLARKQHSARYTEATSTLGAESGLGINPGIVIDKHPSTFLLR
jgi:hypothetical protein